MLKVKIALGKIVERILSLRLLRDQWLLLFIGLGFLGRFRFWCSRRRSSPLLLLGFGRGYVLRALVDINQLSPDSFNDGLVGDGLVEADGVGNSGAFGGADEPRESRFQDGCDANICERDAFGDKERTGREVRFEVFEGTGVAFAIEVINLRIGKSAA